MQRIDKDCVTRSFDAKHPPAARVRLGEAFVMETNDRLGGWETLDARPTEQLSVMTGPVFIEGARPGAVLAVEILEIRPTQPFGCVLTLPGFGVFKDRVGFDNRVVPIEGNDVRFSDDITLPYCPMVGKLGLAPAGEAAPSNATGAFGGQLSLLQVGPGATVYLPVAAEGGLLSIEDVHACMGDGEATSSAVEMAAEATVRCNLADDYGVSQPLVMTADEVLTTGTGETLEAAAEVALEQMAHLLESRLDVDRTEAAMLLGIACDVQISDIGGLPRKVRVAAARNLLGL